MFDLLFAAIQSTPDLFKSRDELFIENLALRQQIAVLNRKLQRPKLKNSDRVFWMMLSKLWKNWCSALVIVKPETVIRWHRKGFKLFWRWKSRRKSPGRPRINLEI